MRQGMHLDLELAKLLDAVFLQPLDYLLWPGRQ